CAREFRYGYGYAMDYW
nr:immunoglobulin heavy chain junction region [Mus musculus]